MATRAHTHTRRDACLRTRLGTASQGNCPSRFPAASPKPGFVRRDLGPRPNMRTRTHTHSRVYIHACAHTYMACAQYMRRTPNISSINANTGYILCTHKVNIVCEKIYALIHICMWISCQSLLHVQLCSVSQQSTYCTMKNINQSSQLAPMFPALALI